MVELTDDQKRAATAPGSAAVVAGAGTGKTRMLAERYLHHVSEHNLSPLSVVAVTFTEKAAAELRSRIRQTLIDKVSDEAVVAEVEAAQISTIHSLAARICRDFYDLAEIPADFKVLDETESPLWAAEIFEEAVALLDNKIADEFGYEWFYRVLRVLLNDPIASEKALELGSGHWQTVIEAEKRAAINELINSEAWHYAASVIRTTEGKAGDKLEDARVSAIEAMDAIQNNHGITDAFVKLVQLKAHLGQAANWPAGDKERVGYALKQLKSAASASFEHATLEFGPDDEEAARRIPPLSEAFAQVRSHISKAKLREKVLDFNDLERYALKVLRHEEALEHYQKRWKAILVDEFQDTNPVQAEIIQRLTRNAKLTIVGDEKQSIYGFRGADVRVFGLVRQQILSEVDGMEVPLALTFRAHSELVAATNCIFEPVLAELHQPLDAHKTVSNHEAPFVQCAVVEDAKGTSIRERQVIEARYIADQIEILHGENGVRYGDIAIIGRRWAPLQTYLDVLSAMSIPAVNAGGGNLLETREAKDIYSLLGFLADPSDSISLVAVLRSPFFAYSDKTLFSASTSLGKEQGWWEMVKTREEFSRPVGNLKTLIEAGKVGSAESVMRLADRLTGYGAVIANLPQGSRRLADMNGMLDLLGKLARLGRGNVFSAHRHIRELYESEIEIPRPLLESGDAVSLMTIHKAKGLEWPVVFIPDLASNHSGDRQPIVVDSELGVAFQMDGEDYETTEPAILKLIKAKQKARDREEAKRLLYVAITRAKDKVYLTASKGKGFDLDILSPGLDAAGVAVEVIPFVEHLANVPTPGKQAPFELPEHINTSPLTAGSNRIPVSALTIYAKCPRQFAYLYVDGHPGIGEGAAAARTIGTLTHLALELGVSNIETLRRESYVNDDDQLKDAIALAQRFTDDPAYTAMRGIECQKEVKFRFDMNGLILEGIADLVGEDFVLDYKTDAEIHPTEHVFQLWAYAKALKKQRAYIAYLKHDFLHEFTADDLAAAEADAIKMINSIRSGICEPTPSRSVCTVCQYRSVCEHMVVE